MSEPASDSRRGTERRLAALKTTYAMPWTRWDPNPRLFSSLKVFKPRVLFGWLWTVWARRSAYWNNSIHRRPVQNCELLVTQGHYGIDTSRTARWDVAGKNRR